MCASWAEPTLEPGGERMRRLLEALELDALLARVERICAAHPERGLAEVWREQKKPGIAAPGKQP